MQNTSFQLDWASDELEVPSRIYSCLERYKLCSEEHGTPFSEYHFEQIVGLVAENRLIELALPAFPAKSSNRQKTHGPTPDLGEYLGLKRLHDLCCEISSFYHPGAKGIICSDGRVFSDLVNVSDEEVSQYSQQIEKLIQENDFFTLSPFNLEDVFDIRSYQEMRDQLVKLHGKSIEEIRENVLTCPHAQAMFNGIHRFIFEDYSNLLEGVQSKNAIRNLAKKLSYQVIQRSNAWGQIVEKFFGHAIRLSIHPQPKGSKKFGFKLVDCENRWGTPWHNVTLFDGNSYQLVKRRVALELGATLKFANNNLPFYTLVQE